MTGGMRFAHHQSPKPLAKTPPMLQADYLGCDDLKGGPGCTKIGQLKVIADLFNFFVVTLSMSFIEITFVVVMVQLQTKQLCVHGSTWPSLVFLGGKIGFPLLEQQAPTQ